jgi:capsid protein
VRARYDAAQTTTENSNHWANADALSARAANSPEIRRTLRNRARYERDNNSYCSGMLETVASHTIGTGPRLQIRTSNAAFNRRVMSSFEEWTAAIGLAEKLRTFREARGVDGEGFLLITNNPRLRTPVQLDLTDVEADQIATPGPTLPSKTAVDGIEFDRWGNPAYYHLLESHARPA